MMGAHKSACNEITALSSTTDRARRQSPDTQEMGLFWSRGLPSFKFGFHSDPRLQDATSPIAAKRSVRRFAGRYLERHLTKRAHNAACGRNYTLALRCRSSRTSIGRFATLQPSPGGMRKPSSFLFNNETI